MDAPSSRRIRLTLHYDGSAFFGWQLQPRERTVQGEIEKVLGRLLNGPARVVGSGRTDRGVHATGQVAAVDVPVRWEPAELRRAMNALLPRDVWVAEASAAEARFHPRYDAVARSYVYRVGTVERTSSPFHRPWCWPLAVMPDLAAMQRAADALPGEHSFLAFAKAGQEHRGDRCVVRVARWREWDDLGVEFHVTANRFLHHMVRYLVGTMVEIGVGRRGEGDLQHLLEQRPGLVTSPPAPAEGLFLSEVRYPGDPPMRDGITPEDGQ